MSLTLAIAEVIGAIGIALLFVYKFTENKTYARWGQAFLILGFSLISLILISLGNFWVGGGFAAGAAIQLYSILKNRLQNSSIGKTGDIHDK